MSVAKMLVPGPPVDVPVLAATVGEAYDEVIGQLRADGWRAFGEIGDPVDAEVSISPSGMLSLTAAGQILLHEIANPAAPPGWWAAVDHADQRVVVLLLPHGLDFFATDFGQTLKGLLGQPDAAAALVRLTSASDPLAVPGERVVRLTITEFTPAAALAAPRAVVLDEYVPVAAAGSRAASWVRDMGRDRDGRLSQHLLGALAGKEPQGGYRLVLNRPEGLAFLLTWPNAALPDEVAQLARPGEGTAR